MVLRVPHCYSQDNSHNSHFYKRNRIQTVMFDSMTTSFHYPSLHANTICLFVSCFFLVSVLWLAGFSALVLQFFTNGPYWHPSREARPPGSPPTPQPGRRRAGGWGGGEGGRQAMLERVERPLYQVVRGWLPPRRECQELMTGTPGRPPDGPVVPGAAGAPRQRLPWKHTAQSVSHRQHGTPLSPLWSEKVSRG